MEFEGSKRISMELSMAPLIDVVFLLLIFFMLTSTMIIPEAVELDLPSAKSASVAEQDELVVSVKRDGTAYVHGAGVSFDELEQEVRNYLLSKPEAGITLRTDEELSIQKALNVMDRLRSAGGSEISIATEPLQ